MILFDFQDDSFVAGPSFHPQHVGFIRREGSYIARYFFRRFPFFILMELLVLFDRTDCFFAPSPNIFDRLQSFRYLLSGLLPLLMRENAVCFFISRTFHISLYIILGALCGFFGLLVGSIGAGFGRNGGNVPYKVFGIVQSTLGFQPFLLITVRTFPHRHYFFSQIGLDIGLLVQVSFGFEVILSREMSIFQLPLSLLPLPRSNNLLTNRRRMLSLLAFHARTTLQAIFHLSFSLNFISPGRERSPKIYSNSAYLFQLGTDGRFIYFVPKGDLIHNISINSKQIAYCPYAVITIIKEGAQFKISQSSNLSLYCRIFFFIEEVSTQPMWSYS